MQRIEIADKGILELADGILRLSWKAGQTIDVRPLADATARACEGLLSGQSLRSGFWTVESAAWIALKY